MVFLIHHIHKHVFFVMVCKVKKFPALEQSNVEFVCGQKSFKSHSGQTFLMLKMISC
jgi:hypothetical protein